MSADKEKITTLTEIITKEIISILSEQENSVKSDKYLNCKVECSEDICIKTCFDNVGEVISAGAERITSPLGSIPTNPNLAKYIDHTLLKPDSSKEKIVRLCEEARTYNFAAVCVNPTHAQLCAHLLKGTNIKVSVVVGFPLGATTPEVKAFEAEQAIQNGASEIDMVINIGAIKDRNLDLAARDIHAVANVVHANSGLLKVIIETCLLTDEEKQIACLIAKEAGADFVKTSTGFSSGGATVEDVTLMRKTVGPSIGVKASTGIKTYEDLKKMVRAGATRIGTSAGIRILRDDPSNSVKIPKF